MADKTITSLCYVDSKSEKTTRLCRIADYVNGRFIPYSYNKDQDFFGENRDLLIGQNYEVLADEGEIAVFDWFSFMSSDNQWRTNVKRNNDVPWCEVQTLTKYASPVAIVEALKGEGVSLPAIYNRKHDLIITCRVDPMGMNAVFLRKEDTKYSNERLYVADNVIKLPIGIVDTVGMTGSCQCRYLQTAQRYMRGYDGFKEKKQCGVKKPVEVVKDIIQGNIGYFDSEVLSRREKQLLRNVVARVTEPTIVDMVCDRLECTPQEANTYINQYVDEAKLKMEKQDALQIIEKLVESDVDAVLEMKKVVKEEWLAENEDLIADKRKEIQHYTDVLRTAEEEAKKEKARVQQGLQAEENKLKKLEKENTELTESVEGLKKLKEELEQEIQDRLDKAKNNLAGSMLDRALMMPAVSVTQPSAVGAQMPKAFSVVFQGEETEKATVYDCHDVAQTDWKRVCGDEDMSSGLALLALAAFACNRSILVAGSGSETIADMLSVSVCGHVPLKLHIRNEADLESLVSEVSVQNHQIICVINGLESGYAVARELMERFRDSRFIFTAMHGESLAMEPESLFSVFFPVLTDYFYNGRHVRELSTLDCSEELLKLEDSDQEKQAFKEAKKIVGKWLKDAFFPPLLKVRCAKLIASMIVLSKELDLGDTLLRTTELELVLTPWLKCLRRNELLQGILENDTVLDDYKKKDLMNYIGVDGI